MAPSTGRAAGRPRRRPPRKGPTADRRPNRRRPAARRHRRPGRSYAAEAAAWQVRLEADTDHALLAQLDAETLAELNAHAAGSIHDPTRAPDADLRDAA
jgi:hypothetical protein